MSSNKNICVFDGSSLGKEKEFLESAHHLGQVLAERDSFSIWGRQPWVSGECVNNCIFRRQSSFGCHSKSFSQSGSHWKNSLRGTASLHNV